MSYRSQNGLTPGVNRRVGRLVYGLCFLFVIGIAWKALHDTAFNPVVLGIIGSISFTLAGLLLHTTGFWTYLK